ncbi:FxDxF family PEP-CTERM protein [uncultured Rhodoferax sp.]|uniref:FxDxF family PEP-CTERM protein n=1 Tax=uncultured Rhodoferax sp. TaxID=223188 RepID=UPI0025DA4703|nr:FxDxF family PEP-CTERM protein [uncultured Rhodoferax sp.]
MNLSVIKKLAVAVSIVASGVTAQAASYTFGSLTGTVTKTVDVAGTYSDTFSFTLPSTYTGFSGSYFALDFEGDLSTNLTFGSGTTTLFTAALPTNGSEGGVGVATYANTFAFAPGNYWFTLSGSGTDANYTVTLAPVPEPETYALMLAGLGLLGVAARRRKASAN